MASGGNIGHKRKTRNNVRLEKNGSDESDEDYRVDEDEELNHSEDDYCSSLAEDESEESLGEFDDDEDEEWVGKKDDTKKVGRMRGRKAFQARKKNTNVKPRKKRITNSEEEDEEEYGDFCLSGVRERKKSEVSCKEDDDKALLQEDEDDLVVENPRKKPRVSRTEANGDSYNEDPKEKDNVSYSEEKEDADYDLSDDSDDEEFTPGEVSKTTIQKPVGKRVSRTKNSSNLSGQFKTEEPFSITRIRKGIQEWKQARSKKPALIVNHDSDSDFYALFDYSDDEEFTPGAVLKSTRQKLVGRRVLRTKNRSSGKIKAEEPFSIARIGKGIQEWKQSRSEKPAVIVNHDSDSDFYALCNYSDDEEFTPAVLKSTRRKPVGRRVLRTKNRSSGKFKAMEPFSITRIRKGIQEWKQARSKKPAVIVNHDSDSDFYALWNYSDDEEFTPSDYEYTMSEEEREQVKEATAFCKKLKTNLRNSSSLKMIEEENVVPSKGKRQGRKGKEKVVDLNIEIGKQVCGICLSEEGKKTVRGVLNCCSHYFCFACIMEWSKVESRCPLCKQRFATISRTARTDGRHDLRDAVFPVPERDQIYQPSEEELRGYLDPYENVLCSECLQGGDDALMLLCDLCDSPAHTFCVGLGREVPDGNWYCDGCRPTALASSNAPGLNPTPENGTSNNLSVDSTPGSTVRETFDLNEAYVPETPLSQVNGQSQSPTPTAPGSGAFTLHDRRRIQRVIHEFINSRSRQSDGSDGVASALVNLFGSPIGRGVVATQNAVMPRMMQPQSSFQGRLADYNTHSYYPRLSNMSGDAFQSQASTSNGHTFGGPSQNEFTLHDRRRIQRAVQEFINSRSRQSNGSDGVASSTAATNLFGGPSQNEFQIQGSTSNGLTFGGLSQNEYARIGGGFVQQQLHPCSATSNPVADASSSPFQFTEGSRRMQESIHTDFSCRWT